MQLGLRFRVNCDRIAVLSRGTHSAKSLMDFSSVEIERTGYQVTWQDEVLSPPPVEFLSLLSILVMPFGSSWCRGRLVKLGAEKKIAQ